MRIASEQLEVEGMDFSKIWETIYRVSQSHATGYIFSGSVTRLGRAHAWDMSHSSYAFVTQKSNYLNSYNF